jgi:hypothetical protein
MVGDSLPERDCGSPCRASDSGFPENRYDALEESRKLLGLTAQDLSCILRVLCKSEFSNLDFDFGSLSISFCTYGDEEICLTFQLEQEGCERSTEYKFRSSDFGVSKKQKRPSDSGEG